MIGGIDTAVRIPSPVDAEWKQKLLRTIFALWPQGVVENVDAVLSSPLSLARVEELGDEFFVYETPATYEAWTELGAVPLAHGGMIHFVVQDDLVTWVVSEEMQPNTSLHMICESVRLGLVARGGRAS